MAPLPERIPLFVPLSRFLRLAGYAEDVVMDVDRHVLLSQAGKVEYRGHDIRFFVVADVHPAFDGWLGGSFIGRLGLEMRIEALTSGGRRPAAGPGGMLDC